jgi:serine/threonine protein kinase
MSDPRGYEIVRKIATGGMAELWLARTPDGEQVAIKRILPQFANDEDFVRMFLDEARIAATLRHPNIVRMREVGSDNGAWFIVMEYLDGENLRALVRQLRSLGRPLPTEQAVSVVLGAAAGLHHAHEQVGVDGRPLRIVHRDVSPQNILLTRQGEVKVLDFGIAKAASRPTETRAGTMKGKIPYMSPEQCGGEALDRRSDVWSLGALLYELTVGRRMVRRGPDYLMMKQILEEGPVSPSSLLPMYPAELERIVLKSLAKRRGQRYQTMEDLRHDLLAFATAQRFDLGPGPLAALMREAFGGAAVPGPDDDELPPPTTEEAPLPAGALPDLKPRAVAVSWVPGPETPRQEKAAQAPAVTRRKVGSVELVAVSGRLSESFRGAELGASLQGDVVVDLSGVQRVTSFGVREWLAMVGAARTSSLTLVRCPEPIVNQLSMIRGFAGSGRVWSFDAPYVCTRCRTTFSRLIEAEADAAAVRAQEPPPATCPSCGGDGTFDDDPRIFSSLAALLATSVPPAVRAVLGPVDPAGRPALEKRVDGAGTHVAVRGPVGPELRWRGVLEGAEGALHLDLSAVTTVGDGAARPLLTALRAVRGDVASVGVVGCPDALLDDLRAEGWLAVEGRAGSAERPLAATPTAALAERPAVPDPAPAPLPPPPPPPPPLASDGRVWLGVGLMGVAAVVLALAGVAFGIVGWRAAPTAPPIEAPAPPPPAPREASLGIEVGAEVVSVVVDGVGATTEEAVADARRAALAALARQLAVAAGRSVDAPVSPDVAARRYEQAFGAVASPSRTDVAPAALGARVTYTVPRAAWDQVVERVGSLPVGGLLLAPALPGEAEDGLLVVRSTDPDVPVGARVTAIDGAPVVLGGAVPPLGGRLLTVVAGGVSRTVRLP